MTPATITVEAVAAKRGPLSVSVDAQGRTRAKLRYTVGAPISGRLMRTTLREGDRIEQGDVLARIAPPPTDARTVATVRAELAAAQARQRQAVAAQAEAASNLKLANSELARRTDLYTQGFIGTEAHETYAQAAQAATSRRDLAQAMLAAAVAADAPSSGPAAAIGPGGFSVGRPSDGRLVNGVQIPASADYDRRYPGSAWGTSFAVRHLVDILHRWREESDYDGLLRLGAMSRQRGRRITGHRSHQSGRDLDIRLPLRAGLPDKTTPTPRRVDWAAVHALVQAFAASGAVTQIFLDYQLQKRLYKVAREAGADRRTLRRLIQFPRGSAATRGLVRHSPGHDIHLHVRFACADYESECAGR